MRWTLLLVFVGALGVVEASDTPTPPRSSGWAVMPGSSIGPVRLGMTKPEVVAVLGEPDRIPDGSEDAWWSYDRDGLAVVFALDIPPEPFVVDLQGGSIAHPVEREKFRARTPNGVGIGSSRDEVVAAFGKADPHEIEDGDLIFSNAGILFRVEDDRVVWMQVDTPIRVSPSR
jgi:hypothetical protein